MLDGIALQKLLQLLRFVISQNALRVPDGSYYHSQRTQQWLLISAELPSPRRLNRSIRAIRRTTFHEVTAPFNYGHTNMVESGCGANLMRLWIQLGTRQGTGGGSIIV